MSSDSPDQPDRGRNKGILITDGADFTVHGIQIQITQEGVEASLGGVTLRQEMTRHWLDIALDHLLDARKAHSELLTADAANDELGRSHALEREFRSSMQAITCSAVSLDAFHTAVKVRISISEDQVKAWRTKRTARWKQMAEIFRLGFGLRPAKVAEMRKILRETAKFRAWAVHPPADQVAPVLHPDTGHGVEWRFVAFRYENARTIVRMALSLLVALSSHSLRATPELGKYCDALDSVRERLTSRWDGEYPDLPVR